MSCSGTRSTQQTSCVPFTHRGCHASRRLRATSTSGSAVPHWGSCDPSPFDTWQNATTKEMDTECIYGTQHEPGTANISVLSSWEMDPNSIHCYVSSFKIRTRSQCSLLLHVLPRDRSRGKKQKRKSIEDWHRIITFSHVNSNVKRRQSTFSTR